MEKIIDFLSHLFPRFGQKIGKIYEVYDLNTFRKNNQIAHPEKFDRYFSLDLDEVSIRKSEVLEAVFKADKESLVKSLLEKEKNCELSALQTVAKIINMLELAYGRLAANGEEHSYKKAVTLNELTCRVLCSHV